MTFQSQMNQLTKSEGKNDTLLCLMCVVFYCILYSYHTAKFYLVYFNEDETVATAKEGAIIESSNQQLTVGDKCHVKSRRKLIDGRVITHG